MPGPSGPQGEKGTKGEIGPIGIGKKVTAEFPKSVRY